MCLCGCEKKQTLFERIQNHNNRHVHYLTTGNNDGHNHSVQAVAEDTNEKFEALCEVMEEELLMMKGHIKQLTKYLIDPSSTSLKSYVNDEAVLLLREAKDEIIKLRAESGFLSEDDMQLK
jgi:hypothetical protein